MGLRVRSQRIIIFFLCFFVGAFLFWVTHFSLIPAQADTDDNIWGHAWSSNIGWVVFNNASQTNVGTNLFNNSTQGQTVVFNTSSFGVDMIDMNDILIDNTAPLTDFGKFSGYAWSYAYGWIDFNGGSCGPGMELDLANYSGYNATGTAPLIPVKGWAEVVAVAQNQTTAGNLGPCISLSGVAADGTPYGVYLDPNINIGNSHNFVGQAWNSSSAGGAQPIGFGWIDFNISGATNGISNVVLDGTAGFECYFLNTNCPQPPQPVTVDLNTTFGGDCNDSPALVTWTSTANPETCTLTVNANTLTTTTVSYQGSVLVPVFNDGVSTVSIMCTDNMGSTDTDTIGLTCSIPECDPLTGDEDGDGVQNADDPSCYDNCDPLTGTYDPDIDNEDRTCTTADGEIIPPFYLEI